MALKSSPKDHHRPQFYHSLSIRIYLRRKITVPVRRFPAGIIKDILQRSIRSVFVQGYCYKLVILAASILSLSVGRYHHTISERSWFSGCPLQAAYTPRSGLSVTTIVAAIFTRVDWTRCSIDPSAPSGRFALVLASFDLADPSPWSRNKKPLIMLNVRIGHAHDLGCALG